jgi:hypothetical protein
MERAYGSISNTDMQMAAGDINVNYDEKLHKTGLLKHKAYILKLIIMDSELLILQ